MSKMKSCGSHQPSFSLSRSVGADVECPASRAGMSDCCQGNGRLRRAP